jgi:hypothetical protein
MFWKMCGVLELERTLMKNTVFSTRFQTFRRDVGDNCSLQYSETNVMHFLFNLLRIKGLYMFQALLAHPQEALHIRHLVYCIYWYAAPHEDEQITLETCRGP